MGRPSCPGGIAASTPNALRRAPAYLSSTGTQESCGDDGRKACPKLQHWRTLQKIPSASRNPRAESGKMVKFLTERADEEPIRRVYLGDTKSVQFWHTLRRLLQPRGPVNGSCL